MGELLYAAKITHVPSMYLSEQPGPHQGCRDDAINGHREISQRCRELGVDTIIVFDRIRENLRKYHKNPLEVILNRSINETLSRTILTSITTLFVVVTLFILGGGIIHDFAFALIVGVLVGTYSSIFVASPVLLWMSRYGQSDEPKVGARAA